MFYETFILPVLRWLGNVLGAIFGFIGMAFGWVVSALIWLSLPLLQLGAVVGVVGALGAMPRDQFTAAWHSGSGHKGMFLGAFSVGLSWGLLIWTCSGSEALPRVIDQAWSTTALVARTASPVGIFGALLPQDFRELSRVIFQASNGPYFDAVILALMLSVSFFSIIRAWGKQASDRFRVAFVHKEVMVVSLALAFTIPAAMLVAFLAVALPREE